MISLIVFLAFLGIALAALLLQCLKDIRGFTFKTFIDALFSKTVLLPFGVALIIFLAASVVPYSLQMKDRYNIAFAEENIVLYNQYISDYSDTAKKQIADYQKFQAQMASQANSIQLQFYSQQIDTVGNRLTDQIKVFNDKILDWKIEINRSKIRLEYRPKNKWVFGVE